MTQQFDNFLKYYGKLKICEECNWDIAEIAQFYKREKAFKHKNQLYRIIEQFKVFIKTYNAELMNSTRMLEIQRKLRGNYDYQNV